MKKLFFIKIFIIIILLFLYQKKNESIFGVISNNLYEKKTEIKNSNFYLKAEYFSEYQNENVQLINKIYEDSINLIIINNTLKIYSSNCNFPEPGLHEVQISMKIEKLTSIEHMFNEISNLVSIYFYKINKNHNFRSLKGVFKECKNLKSINFNNFSFNNISDLSHLFFNCKALTFLYPSLHLSEKVTNLSFMFANCSSLASIDLSYFNTINTKDMSGLFYGCSNLTSIDLTNFKTFSSINIEFMFAGCSSLKSINLEFLENKKIENFNNAFLNCSNLKSVTFPYLDEKLKNDIKKMFIGCNKFPLKKLLSKSNNINDICIVGLWFGSNYGSMLTYYALHEVAKSFNYSILMIDDPLEPDNMNYSNLHPKYMLNSLYRISEKNKLDNLYEFNKICKSFLVGSDQIWNVYLSRRWKQFFFLGFANNETKKFSYATSFGTRYKGNEKEKQITKENLKRFNSISVRDKLSLDILQNEFGIKNAVQVCDPTLLCNISCYMNLLNKANIKYIEEYLLAYVLDPNPEIGNRLEKLSIEMKIKVIIILDLSPEKWEFNKNKLSLLGNGNVEVKNIVSINEWLWFYNNSKAVFTDSYHGTIFSIIFKKPFITLINRIRGEQRIYSLLSPLKLMHRQFKAADCINKRQILFKSINYTIPLRVLSKIKKDSYNWLKNELSII